jgi:predicted nucleic acid-binding protein
LKIFFDTSVLVKLFHRESGSPQVENLFIDHSIVISELAIAEFYSATLRKYREKAVTEHQLREILSAFDEQCAFFTITPLRGSVIDAAKQIIRQGGRKHSLRTLDALQLASYSLIADSSWAFACTDIQLLALARTFRIKTINPLE